MVHVLPPVFPICGHGDLPVGPLTGQVDADACNNGGPVLQAEGGEVQTARHDTTRMHPYVHDFLTFIC